MILDVFITKANRNMQQQIISTMGTKLYSIFDRIMGNCFFSLGNQIVHTSMQNCTMYIIVMGVSSNFHFIQYNTK